MSLFRFTETISYFHPLSHVANFKAFELWSYFRNYGQLFGIMVKSMELCNIEKNPLNFGQR